MTVGSCPSGAGGRSGRLSASYRSHESYQLIYKTFPIPGQSYFMMNKAANFVVLLRLFLFYE
jgi:hypothetical protein